MRIEVERAALLLRKAASLRPPAVPAHVHLRPCDEPHWHAILHERPNDEWDDGLLPAVASLAWVLAEIERERARLRVEGAVIRYAGTGSRRRNPRATLVLRLTQLMLGMRRTLRLGGVVRKRKR